MEKFEIIHINICIYIMYYVYADIRNMILRNNKQVHAKNAGKSINIVSCYVL